MEGKPPEEGEREQPTQAGWLPPVPPGPPPQDPGVFAPPPYQPPPQQAAAPPPGPQSPAPGQEPAAPAPGPQSPAPPQYQPPPPAPGYGPPGGQPPGYGAPPPPGWNPPPWQQPGWQPTPQGPGNGTAITGFVLSVSSIALLFFTAGLSTILSLGLSIAGAIVGRNGREKVDRGETTQHRGLGQAGFIIGIVGAVLSVVAILLWVLFLTIWAEALDDLDTDDDLFDEDFQTTRAVVTVVTAALRLTL